MSDTSQPAGIILANKLANMVGEPEPAPRQPVPVEDLSDKGRYRGTSKALRYKVSYFKHQRSHAGIPSRETPELAAAFRCYGDALMYARNLSTGTVPTAVLIHN